MWFAFLADSTGPLQLRGEPAAPAITTDEPVRLGVFRVNSEGNVETVGMAPDGALEIATEAGVPYWLVVDGPEGWVTLLTAPPEPPASNVDPPVITCTPPEGWHTEGIVPCEATDAGSGLAAPRTRRSRSRPRFRMASSRPTPPPRPATCDAVGNSALAGPVAVKVDRAMPVVACAAPSEAWAALDVQVTCTATDGGSGVGGQAQTSFAISTAVPAGTETDVAAFIVGGPCATTSATAPPSPHRRR